MSKSLYSNYSTLVSRSVDKEVDKRGSLLNSHVLVKQEQLHDSLQMRVFSILMSWRKNPQKQTRTRIAQESTSESFLSALVGQEQQLHEVDKPEFSQLSCPGQTKANKSCKRFEARVGMNVF